MSTFDHKMFLWNKDHSFKDYKNQEILIEDLAEFLGCELISEEEKILVNTDNLLTPTQNLTISKNGFLIVAKDKDSKIINEALNQLTLGPNSIKEINFGWQIDKSFKYHSEDLQWAQDLQESSQALRVNPSSKKVEPGDRLKEQNFAESSITDSYYDSPSVNDCYWVKMSSFSGWSNNSNKLLEFLSWPNRTIKQTGDHTFFVSENKISWGTHYDAEGVMNWGTNSPSLIGITCGNAETGTWENNIFKYENQEFLLPSGGQIIRVFRQPAEDLTLPELLTYRLEQLGAEEGTRWGPEWFFGYIPTLYQWVPDYDNGVNNFARVYTEGNEANTGYRVRLSNKTHEWAPWIERSSATEYYEWTDSAGNRYERDATPGPFLDDFYTNNDLESLYGNGETTRDPDDLSYDYWYEKFFSSSKREWKPESWSAQSSYVAALHFPAVEVVAIDDLLKEEGYEPLLVQNTSNHLIIKNHTYTYPINVSTTVSEDKVHFAMKPFTKFYRSVVEGWKEEPQNTNINLKILFTNFCLYPNEQLKNLVSFTPEIQRYYGRAWEAKKNTSKNNEDKYEPQSNYLGLSIKMFWKPRLINPITSEFVYPRDCRDRPTVAITVDGKQATVEKFQHWGCWDLLAHRITSLSCFTLFENEQVITGETNYVSFLNSTYKEAYENPVLLWYEKLSSLIIPEDNNFSSLEAPLFYWPSLSDETRILIFKNDYNESETPQYEYVWGYETCSHKKFQENKSRGYRKVGQDYGAVAFFVEPDAERIDFNVSSVYGWYWIDNSIHINFQLNEDTQQVQLQIINYSLSSVTLQIADNETIINELAMSNETTIQSNTTISINGQVAFTIQNPVDYQGLWKIKSNNQVYKDNILYGIWTEEGIQPYENE